jgi:hypothetical protein
MLCNVKHIKKILKIEEIKEDDLSDVPAEDAQKEENIPAPPAVPPEENKQKNPLSDMIGNIFTPPAPPKQTVPNYVAGGARKIRRRTRHRRPKKQNKTKSQIM